jgi:TatD DNase family protein
MIDVHCHLTDLRFEKEIENIIHKAKAAGITAIITNGTSVEDSRKAVEMAEKYPEVWATVGIHPEEIFNFQLPILNELSNLAKHKKVVGIGEIGLDYREGITETEKDRQGELFKIQLDLASELELPVVVHNRRADEDIYQIISNVQYSKFKKVLMHCFTRNAEYMQKMAYLGAYFSFGGMITYENNQRMRNVAKMVAQDRLLLETDSPFSVPKGVENDVNSPINVKIVARKMAEIRETTVNELVRLTTENARRLFRLT